MAEEKIGKPCDCIYAFEKSIILDALNNRIDTIKADIERIEKTPDTEFPPFAKKEAVIDMNEFALFHIETVRKRVESMPVCDH